MSGFVSAPDGRRIAFDDTGGGGLAVLCLPGLTRNMADFDDLARHLAPRYRVVRLDYRGRGASGWADDPLAEYTPAVESQDVLALAAHLGIARGAVIGTSRGGIIGMLLAATRPDFVAGLVLNDIGAVIERAGLDFIMSYIGQDPGVADFDAAARRLKAIYGAAFRGLDDAEWLAFARRSFRDDGGRPALNYDPELRAATAAALETSPPDLWGLFGAIKAPLLTIRAANSNLLTAETLAEMARRRPDMAHVTIAERGHPAFLDEPPALAAIDRFLAELTR